MARPLSPEEAAIADAAAHGSREASLAAAVISQALADAGLLGEPPRSVELREQREALSFCTADSGPWRAARLAWLDLLDIEPAVFARRVEMLLRKRRRIAA